MKEFNILIGGQAGYGSRKAGLLIAKIFNALGYQIFIYDDYQSLVRGGHSFSKIRAAESRVLSQADEIDILLCLDEETFNKHRADLKKGGLIIFNSNKFACKEGIGINADELVAEFKGKSIMANTALLAGFAKIIGIEWKLVEKIFKREMPKQIEENLQIAKKAYSSQKENLKIEKLKNDPLPLLTGNEALALGAAQAGLEMYYAYPMTPATGILHFLANENVGVQTMQMENEISVLITALGSAFAGKRAMVGTSGGGFALMAEGISLAAISETPVVIVDSQRAGPASGVPTYNAQADLNFVLNVGHGDIVKFTIAPGDIDECFEWGGKILNLAWKYQTPAVLLVDKELSESTASFKETEIKKEEALMWNKKGEYMRYQDTEDGISPLAFPPFAISKASSYEHDEFGFTIEESEEDIQKMQEKRLAKFDSMQEEVLGMQDAVKVFGNKKSKTVLITWGSSKGAVKEAAEKLGLKMIQIIVLEPFPLKQVLKAIGDSEKIYCIEQNALGQLARLLAEKGIDVDEVFLKYTSRPFLPGELEDKLKEVL